MKKKLKKAGFFRELRHGESSGPSIREWRASKPIEYEDKIVNYLESGILHSGNFGLVLDVFGQNKIIGLGPDFLTDGIWVWPNDLSYYIKNHYIEIPKEFLAHIISNNWTVPPKKNLDLSLVEANL